MVFDTVFSVRQGTHLVARLGQNTIVFRAAFFGTRFAAAGAVSVEVAGDGQQHLVNQGGDRSGFIFDSAGGVGKLADGIQAAFKGDAIEIDIMSEGGLLHDAADEIIRDKMHPQFAFDQKGVSPTQALMWD